MELQGILIRICLLGIFAFLSIGLWRGRINAASYGVLLSGTIIVLFLISVPFEKASRLVVAGVEIDSRIAKAEEILARLKLSESNIQKLDKHISINIKKIDMNMKLMKALHEVEELNKPIGYAVDYGDPDSKEIMALIHKRNALKDLINDLREQLGIIESTKN